jgi:hypothetical protein
MRACPTRAPLGERPDPMTSPRSAGSTAWRMCGRGRVVAGGLAALALLASGAPVAATPLRAERLSAGEPLLRIDGRLDEAAWSRAPVHDRFTTFLPVGGEPPPAGFGTHVQVLVEPDAIVFGVRSDDPDPARLRAPLLRRDQVRRDQDFVSVLLDAVGDRRSAQLVRVNAAGVIADGTFIADRDSTVDGQNTDEDFSPDFDVEAATTVDERGWTLELRIPFASLRQPRREPGVAPRPWRVMVTRSIPRASSTLLLSTPLPRDALSFIAELQPLEGLEDVAERLAADGSLQWRPEFTLRQTRGTGEPERREASLGVGFKWRPSADWVVDATLNPDFSQVELDVPQLAGNTRFALAVPEKRAFFLESTDVLDLPLAGFYSRSIADPRAGVRATWRGPSGDATALALRDDGGGLVLLPGPYGTGVARQPARTQVHLVRGRWHLAPEGAGRLTAGVMATSREYQAAGRNDVAGADLLWRPNAGDRLRLRVLTARQTARFDPATGDGPRAGPAESGSQWTVAGARRSDDWNVSAEFVDTDPRFRNDNGFVEQAGVRRLQAEVIRRWGEQRFGPLVAHDFETYLWVETRQVRDDPGAGVTGGETIQRQVHAGIWGTAPLNSEAWAQVRLDAARARPGGRLHPLPGVQAQWLLAPAAWITALNAEVDLGQRLDVVADRAGPGAVWLVEAKWRAPLPRIGARPLGLEVEQRVQQGFVRAADGARALTDTAARLLAVLHLGPRDSVRVVGQAVRTVRAADAPAGVTAGREQGRDLSLVYQHRQGVGRQWALGASQRRQVLAPAAAPSTIARQAEVFAKATVEF